MQRLMREKEDIEMKEDKMKEQQGYADVAYRNKVNGYMKSCAKQLRNTYLLLVCY